MGDAIASEGAGWARLRQEADLFFRFIEGHGRFNERQLYRFVELKTGSWPEDFERRQLLEYAKEKGAKREKGLYEVYQLPAAKRRRIAKKTERATGDLFAAGRE